MNINFLNRKQLIDNINSLSASNEPFIFIVDYKGEKGLVIKLSQLKDYNISCKIENEHFGINIPNKELFKEKLDIKPIPFSIYKKQFSIVKKALQKGNSYLLNLTFPTQITTPINLQQIYAKANAKFKFLLPDNFIFYSPETFYNNRK